MGRVIAVTIGYVPDPPVVGSAADGVGVTDTTSTVMTAARAQDDPVGLTDSVSAVMSVVRSIADAIGLTDSATASLNNAVFGGNFGGNF